ncbi:protein LTV1 homolog [Stegodyphus dumicola]|uniref:protein LTV1 homolog n=1 Tax=Stegodyphus dumicola TaxID=202533 RepID=UPI0015B10130|nr:protein LTV1 homolog [Stegodyphus dumicola]
MPTKKKKAFTKDNSVKYLLLHGNTEAVNADGETLQNVFVPVSKNYKAGSSLLFSNLPPVCQESVQEEDLKSEDHDLEKIMETFDDDSDLDEENISFFPADMKNESVFESHNRSKRPLYKLDVEKVKEDSEDESNYSDACSQFSDADIIEMFPGFSLTSARSDGPKCIKTFNERFEKVFEEYDDDQIGALDDEEICGHLSAESERVQSLLGSRKEEEKIELGSCDESLKEKILQYAETKEEEKIVEVFLEKPLEFDCESILSTYSNKYNHPTVIREKPKKVLTKHNLKQFNNKNKDEKTDGEDHNDSSVVTSDDDKVSVASSFNNRCQGETPEQRRERKRLFKEFKRQNRILKKECKLAHQYAMRMEKSQQAKNQEKVVKLL